MIDTPPLIGKSGKIVKTTSEMAAIHPSKQFNRDQLPFSNHRLK